MKSTQGFTLIELLIVIAIIGILAAVLIPNLLGAREKANITAAQAFGRECITAIETARDNVTGTLKTKDGSADLAANATCLDIMGRSALPAAVNTAVITAVNNKDTYEIEVVPNVKSTTAKWAYNGEEWSYTK